MALVHLQPVVIVIVCHAIATNGEVGGVLDHGLCPLLAEHMSRNPHFNSVWLVEAIDMFGPIRWCPFDLAAPSRAANIKCLQPRLQTFNVCSGVVLLLYLP